MTSDHKSDASDSAFDPSEWISAAEAIRRVRDATLSPRSHETIATRANAGLIRARAKLVIIGGNRRFTDTEVPEDFWWAKGRGALEQNWETGDFSTVRSDVRVQAFGVQFHVQDIAEMLGGAVRPAPPEFKASAAAAPGRPMSNLWPDWVAELVAWAHESGIPSHGFSTDALIETIAARLTARGLEAPSRSTVQDTARAVLRRLQGAGK